MYVTTIPNRDSPPAILLRESVRVKDKIHTRTLANLTHWAPPRIEALRRALKGEFDGVSSGAAPVCGLVFGVLSVLKQLADRLGISRVLGTERRGKLALLLVLHRVAQPGSRLSAVRWAQSQAVAEVLGLGPFDEDDLYATLDWLAPKQASFEDKLYRQYLKRTGSPPAIVLYDVTSTYCEGQQNELAAFGYNRDKKQGKKQIVVGLLTTTEGEPLAVAVFTGNTADPSTVPPQVATLKQRFGIREVVMVGDRGMLKAAGQTTLAKAGFRYITALTTPQVRKLLRQQILQLQLFTTQVHEVEQGKRRLVLRRNEAVRREEERRRADKLSKLQRLLAERNAFVRESKRADPQAGLRKLTAWVKRHALASFVRVDLRERTLRLEIDAPAQAAAGLLDGCYVLTTDVASTTLSAQQVHDRYLDLQTVEQDFRTMKTGQLEVRPLFVRKAARTRAHVFVTMLALKVVRELRRGLTAVFGTTDTDPYAVTVADALRELARLCLLTYDVPGAPVTCLPRPDERQQAILAALSLPWPKARSLRKM